MSVRFTVTRSTLWSSLASVLMAAGLGAVLYSGWFLVDGAVYQHTQRAEFLQPAPLPVSVSVEEPAATAPLPVNLAPLPLKSDSNVFAQLTIASVDLDVMVGEGVDKSTLRRAAGHLTSSAKPGERGNFVVLAHRDTFFRPLRNLERGDIAEIRTVGGVFRYRIDAIRVVEPEDVDVNTSTGNADIVLVTCYPFRYMGPSPRRFVARGRLIESGTSLN